MLLWRALAFTPVSDRQCFAFKHIQCGSARVGLQSNRKVLLDLPLVLLMVAGTWSWPTGADVHLPSLPTPFPSLCLFPGSHWLLVAWLRCDFQQHQLGNIPAVGDRGQSHWQIRRDLVSCYRKQGGGIRQSHPVWQGCLACCSVSCSAVPEREERLMSAVGYCHFLLFPQLSGRCL